MKTPNVRFDALLVLSQVLEQGKALDDALASVNVAQNPKDTALLKFLCYGLLREYEALDYLLTHLLDQPLSPKALQLRLLLLLGLLQLKNSRMPPYAVIHETVALTKKLKLTYASGLVNAVLRRFEREKPSQLALLQNKFFPEHPAWLIARLQQHYPDCWQTIIRHNNTPALMHLRVNTRKTTRRAYLASLETCGIKAYIPPGFPDAITLEAPVDVEQLPQFNEGLVSVQDLAAQLTPHLLQLHAQLQVLDACAAPGGKSCHMLEAAAIDLTSLDVSTVRLQKLQANLIRLGLHAKVVAEDALQFAHTAPSAGFDRILLDAPCSGIGVIRRHPDIKFLRRESDIAALHATQVALLTALAALLKHGGYLLYATCSILPEENDATIKAVLSRLSELQAVPLFALPLVKALPASPYIRNTAYGIQFLPEPKSHDGFYYALIKRSLA